MIFLKKQLEWTLEVGFFFNFCDFCFSWTMDHALSHLEYFDCQGHNSLNFGPIFKILVPQHISFPRPFFFIY